MVNKWNDDRVREYAMCAKSVKYFVATHCQVNHPIHGFASVEHRPRQFDLLDCLEQNRLTVMNCPRQVGKTTITSLYCLWYAMFSLEPKEIWILANKGHTARGILDDIKDTYDGIESYIKSSIVGCYKTKLEFKNGSSINVASTTIDAIRGTVPSLLVLDEFAHVPTHIADQFFTSIAPVFYSVGAKFCMISTPDSNSGKFHDVLNEAKNNPNSNFKYFEW